MKAPPCPEVGGAGELRQFGASVIQPTWAACVDTRCAERLQSMWAGSTTREASYNFSSSMEFPGFGGSGVRTFSGAGAAFAARTGRQTQLISTRPPRVRREPSSRALQHSVLARASWAGSSSSLPAWAHVGSNNRVAQTGPRGELFVSAWGGGGRVHSFPNKRLIILPLGPEIQLKKLWLPCTSICTRMERASWLLSDLWSRHRKK